MFSCSGDSVDCTGHHRSYVIAAAELREGPTARLHKVTEMHESPTVTDRSPWSVHGPTMNTRRASDFLLCSLCMPAEWLTKAERRHKRAAYAIDDLTTRDNQPRCMLIEEGQIAARVHARGTGYDDVRHCPRGKARLVSKRGGHSPLDHLNQTNVGAVMVGI